MSNIVFTIPQSAAYHLIQNDMRYIYTIFANKGRFKSNYIVSSMPFVGLIVDCAEEWFKRIQEIYKIDTGLTFTKEEKSYYDKMRGSIKMWESSYESTRDKLQNLYESSDKYFAFLKGTKKSHDIFGADKADGKFCGNTILCSSYIPDYKFGEDDGEYIKQMNVIAGKYLRLFDAMNEYEINKSMKFTYVNYGGCIESPVGNIFSDNFVLFSMLCQIQFVLYGVEKFIVGECSTKLRFAYLQYFYCAGILEEINNELGTNFKMDTSKCCGEFRNAMAHYKVGVALKPEEIIMDDLFYGMTQKFFGCSYFELKEVVMDNLLCLAEQLKEYLQI